MKHKHQMSLIARRAQIRRAAAGRKDLPSAQPAVRPALRLVSSNHDVERDRQNEYRTARRVVVADLIGNAPGEA